MTRIIHTDKLKQCFQCKETKHLLAFSKHLGMADGHLGKCKECAKTYSKQHRKDNPEYYKAFEKERNENEERKQSSVGYIRNYRRAHPERVSCNQKLVRAVKAGKVVPEPCFICGDKAVGHHFDYSQPLLVTWLCPPHHRQLHSEFERKE